MHLPLSQQPRPALRPNGEDRQTMAYRIKNIRLFVRETKPARLALSLGKKAQGAPPPAPTTSPLCHLHLEVEDDSGATSFGCSADRLSVRWLDKRPGRSKSVKLQQLVSLLENTRDIYLQRPKFENPFGLWLVNHSKVMALGRSAGQEDLTSVFASSLFERALVIDPEFKAASDNLSTLDNEISLDLNGRSFHE